jgi:hypothetical protein
MTNQRATTLSRDVLLTASQLDVQYNLDGDGEHPIFKRSNWREAVAHETTLLGYWEWVERAVEAAHTQENRVGDLMQPHEADEEESPVDLTQPDEKT